MAELLQEFRPCSFNQFGLKLQHRGQRFPDQSPGPPW
jgi:hypothetical protein